MPNTSSLDKFLKPTHVKEGQRVRIITAGRIYDKTFNTKRDGEVTRTVLEVEVELPNGDVKTWNVDKMSRQSIEEKHGTETENWVDKEYRVNLVMKDVYGKMVQSLVLTPVNEE
jgi:predicted DNA-binding antitoxin AbrB/MazE fold protein